MNMPESFRNVLPLAGIIAENRSYRLVLSLLNLIRLSVKILAVFEKTITRHIKCSIRYWSQDNKHLYFAVIMLDIFALSMVLFVTKIYF